MTQYLFLGFTAFLFAAIAAASFRFWIDQQRECFSLGCSSG
jgi:hypothetical protein